MDEQNQEEEWLKKLDELEAECDEVLGDDYDDYDVDDEDSIGNILGPIFEALNIEDPNIDGNIEKQLEITKNIASLLAKGLASQYEKNNKEEE